MYGTPENTYQQQNNNYQQQPAQQPVSMSLDSVMQGGTPSAFGKNDPIGTSVEGDIVSIEAQQQTDFTTNRPLFYPNGNPKPQVVIHLKTNLHDPEREFDDGMRAVYVKGYNIASLRQASQQAGRGNFPHVGDHLKATFSSTRPAQQRGYNDAKLYTYVVTPGDPGKAALEAAMTAPQPEPQAQQGDAWGQPATQPQQQAYGQPQYGVAQPQRQDCVTPQQAAQILQLKAVGKAPQEIAGMMGLTLQQVLAVSDAANPSAHAGSEQTDPAFTDVGNRRQ